jgi:K+-transporting ATPase KdpF subunit
LAWSPPASGSDSDAQGAEIVLYLTALVTVAALVYLVYAMLRPERF